MTASEPGPQSQRTARATSSGSMNRPIGLSEASAARASSVAHRSPVANDGSHAPLEKRRLREPRTDRVRSDPGPRKLDGEGAGEAHDPVLGRAIGGDVGVALEAGGGRDRDESPPPCVAPHGGEAVTEGAVTPGQVHLDHLLPHLGVEPRERGARGRPGIGDDDGRRASLASRPLERGAKRVVVGHVGRQGMQAVGRPGREPLQCFAPSPDEGHPGAHAGERFRDGGADPGARAGDHRVPALEEPHRSDPGPASRAGPRSVSGTRPGPGPRPACRPASPSPSLPLPPRTPRLRPGRRGAGAGPGRRGRAGATRPRGHRGPRPRGRSSRGSRGAGGRGTRGPPGPRAGSS